MTHPGNLGTGHCERTGHGCRKGIRQVVVIHVRQVLFPGTGHRAALAGMGVAVASAPQATTSNPMAIKMAANVFRNRRGTRVIIISWHIWSCTLLQVSKTYDVTTFTKDSVK